MTRTFTHRPPKGSRDLLPAEVAQKQQIERQLVQVFQGWGYSRIITPMLERLDTLTAGGAIQPDSVLQLRDREGTLLGLRPELTASIVRAAATRMEASPLPLRLFYHGSVFRNAQREQEFFQAGVELLGAGDWLADAEVLLVLSECLQRLRIQQWTLILGDVVLTQGLLGLISPGSRQEVQQAIVNLDRVNLESMTLSDSDRQLAIHLLELRGQPHTVFQRLTHLPLGNTQKERVIQLQQLCHLLQQQGVEVVLDLSLLQPFAYYTGVVFRAVAANEMLGSGGRYDRLYDLYSPQRDQRPGIGFTLMLEPLQRLLQQQGLLPSGPFASQRLLVPQDSLALSPALQLAHRWRQADPSLRLELELLHRSPEELEVYCRQRQIPEIVWIQPDGSFHSSYPLQP